MVIVLVTLLCFGSALAASTDCVAKNLTTVQKVHLNADANDHDGNRVITASDVKYDLDHNYDTNGDGAVDETEWITRWTCAFGDTAYFARFTFNLIGQGEPEIRASQFTGEPFATGVSRSDFVHINRQRYGLFRQYHCVNKDLTREQKLAINLEHNNHNNDSVVDSSDIAYDLNNNYDTDNDTRVTKAEWVVRWCCVYGDTGDYARYVWDQLSQGATYVQASMFAGPPFDTGIPLDQFKETNRQRYEKYAAAQAQSPVGK